MSLTLRQAVPSDAEELLAIYAPYVRETTVTFEYKVPPLAAFRERMERICAIYPWLVCEQSGEILGYAYADLPFSIRSACAWNTDLSVYLTPEAQGQGIGRMLYGALLALLERLGYRNAYGLITGENAGSLAFHRKMGFTVAGTLRNSGFKFGRWMDVFLVEKTACAYGSPAQPPMKIGALPPDELRRLLAAFER